MDLHRYDLMHIMFLGFCLHLTGSILIDLCDRKHWPGHDLRSRLRRAWYEFKEWVKLYGFRRVPGSNPTL